MIDAEIMQISVVHTDSTDNVGIAHQSKGIQRSLGNTRDGNSAIVGIANLQSFFLKQACQVNITAETEFGWHLMARHTHWQMKMVPLDL